MAKITQAKVPPSVIPLMKKAGVRIKTFKSAESFERVLKKFLKRNNVLHLSTCKNNRTRTTPLEYRLDGFTFYILSGGGVKFENLKKNKNVSFSIAEPYNPEEDFWGTKGLQAFGTAEVYSLTTNPKKFKAILKKMKVQKSLKQMGLKEFLPEYNYRIIEITPHRMRLGSMRDGVFKVTWEK